MTTLADEEDFGDDEDFGLDRGTGQPDASASGDGADNGDVEEDLYADITVGQTPRASSTDLPGVELLVAERVASGQQAEASGSKAIVEVPIKPQQQGGQHGPLPKKLADTVTLYIGELQWWTTDAELEALCGEFGEIESITFFEDKSNGKSKGYALVKFGNKEAANLCRHAMNGMMINGKKCVVTFSSSGNPPKSSVAVKEPSTASGANGSTVDRGPSTTGRGQGASSRGRGGRTGMSRPAEPFNGGMGMGMAPPMPPMGMMPGMGMPGMGMPGIGIPGMGMGIGMPGMGMPGMGNQFLPMPGMPFMGPMQQGPGNNEEDVYNKRRRY